MISEITSAFLEGALFATNSTLRIFLYFKIKIAVCSDTQDLR